MNPNPINNHKSTLITHHSSLITHHSSLITHHSSLINPPFFLRSPHSATFAPLRSIQSPIPNLKSFTSASLSATSASSAFRFIQKPRVPPRLPGKSKLLRTRISPPTGGGETPAVNHGTIQIASSLHGLSRSFGPSARMRKACLVPEMRPGIVAELRVDTFTCTHAPGVAVSE
jgi:hypothetical protein